MEKILRRLGAQGSVDEKVRRELASLWRYGIEKVGTTSLRAGLVDFLENEAPLYFFTAPASLTGRYHPRWQVQEAGIIRNTVECCLALDRQLRDYPEFTEADGSVQTSHRDIVLVATILTDCFKYGLARDGSTPVELKFDGLHGKLAAERWLVVAARNGVAASDTQHIYEAVYWHLGRWTPGWEASTARSPYVDITHRVDMFMSDKNLELLYDPKSCVGAENLDLPGPLEQARTGRLEMSEDFERAKTCYQENCEAARGLNQVMWQVPIIAMTVTGGLWYGAASLSNIEAGVKYALLFFVGLADLLLIFVIQRVRSVMAAYLRKIKEFHPSSFAETQSGEATRWLRERGVVNTFSVLLLIAALMSFIGLFFINSGSTVPRAGSGAEAHSPARPGAH